MTQPTHHAAALDQSRARDVPESHVRWSLIRRIRRELALGTYPLEQRWEATMARIAALHAERRP